MITSIKHYFAQRRLFQQYRRVAAVAPGPGEGPFSIAASVKLWTDDFMLSPFCAPADDDTRGTRFSSRSASGRLMMG